MELQPEWNEFLRLLLHHGVRFVMVGGLAVAVHGHERYTKDLDGPARRSRQVLGVARGGELDGAKPSRAEMGAPVVAEELGELGERPSNLWLGFLLEEVSEHARAMLDLDVLTIELRDRRGATPIQFDVLATSGLPAPVAQSQLELARHLAPAMGIKYYFLVTLDEIRGWDMASGSVVFAEPTAKVLTAYATAGDVTKAGPSYLSALVQAWVADLSSRWKSRTSPAPGEIAMHTSGALDVIRTSEQATSGSL